MPWSEWVYRESTKRILCGSYILCNLIVITFDASPGMINAQDLAFEAPDAENLWTAGTADEWRQRCVEASPASPRMIRDILMDVVRTNKDAATTTPTSYKISGLTALVVMHAVCVYFWTKCEFSRIFGHDSLSTSTSMAALARCHTLLMPQTDGDGMPSWDGLEVPMAFNYHSILRIAYAQLLTSINVFNRMTLVRNDLDEIRMSLNDYVDASQERGRVLTIVAAKVLQGFRTPVKMGHLLMRKTAAFSWSIEHAVAGWDGGESLAP